MAPQDVDFHPTLPLLATGVIDGRLLLHSCSPSEAAAQHSVKAHDRDNPCRAVRFSLGGELVLTGSTDRSILAVDVATGKARARKRDAHAAPVTRLAGLSATLAASGDENGAVALWDSRQSDAVAALDPHSDYVSDFYYHANEQALLSVSGDGTLALTDLRTKKVREASEGDADDELLSVTVIKGGRKIVCGTTSGVLDIWSWGFWADCSDRFPGHPDSVTAVIKCDEDTVLTASSDGIIRVVSVQPNKLVGVVGEHGEMDIERMAATSGLTLLASASHDNTVKVWDLAALLNDDDEEEEEGEEEKAAAPAAESEEEDSDDSDSDGGRAGKKRKKRANTGKGRGDHKIKSKKKGGGAGGNFFADLL